MIRTPPECFTSNCRKRKLAETMQLKSLAPFPFHFFKIILPDTLQVMKLRIPQAFVREFGGALSPVVTLTVPNGRVWKVGLKREEGKIWFNDGWNHFVKHHSIYAGCFLVFRYQQNSNFDVLIFDKTACEIQYPYNDEEPTQNVQQNSDYGNESRRGKLKMDEMYNSKGSLDPKNHWNRTAEDLYASSSFGQLRVNKRTICDDFKVLDSLEEDTGISFTRRNKGFSTTEKKRAISIAQSNRPNRPKNPAFMVIIISDNITKNRLYVPINFSKKYLDSDLKYVKVQDCHGKEWPFRVTWNGNVGYYLDMWSQFSKDKNLGKGDICLFELIRMEDMLLKVSIFQAADTFMYK